MDETIDRRTALRLGGAATVAAVAGCSNLPGGSDSSSGSKQYSQYLGVRDDQVFFAYADFEALEEFDTGEQNSGGSGGSDSDLGFDEPMLAPAGGLFLIAFSAGFQLASLGLGGLIQTDEESDLDSQGNQILLANETLVVIGDMDTGEIDERLTSSSDENFFATEYEQTEEADGYTFYEPAETSASGSEGSVVAVSGSELLSASSREAVDSVVSAKNGDGRAADEFDEFQWLLDNGGDGLIALGGYGPEGFDGFGEESGSSSDDSSESELDIVENSGGFVGSISLDSEEATSVLAASSDQISEDQQSQIESDFQSERTDVSIDFQGDGRLVAEATYSRDVLENSGSDSSA